MEDSAATQPSEQPRSKNSDLVRFARPALIAGVVVAVVCVALLVIVLFLDTFNATVYSVGGKDIQDATDEARDIRSLYSGARIGAIVLLVISLLAAMAGAVVLYLKRSTEPDEGNGAEDVDFDDLGH
jgi:ribose/xylose/arabinose/galactoside ABC-type transport system permease subunit